MGKLAQKKDVVAKLKETFEKTELAVVADYRGFTVEEITDLRTRLRENEAELKIAKNTLIKHAIKETNLAELESLLQGPTAMLVGFGDPSSPAKTLFEFVKEVEKGDIRGGVFEGKLLSKEQLKEFASLPSKEVLLGQIAGLLIANTRDIAGIFEGVIRDNALLIEEVAKKNEASGGAAKAEEKPAEEAKAEEPKAEEKPAEEAKAEDPKAEEKPAEEKKDGEGPKLP